MWKPQKSKGEARNNSNTQRFQIIRAIVVLLFRLLPYSPWSETDKIGFVFTAIHKVLYRFWNVAMSWELAFWYHCRPVTGLKSKMQFCFGKPVKQNMAQRVCTYREKLWDMVLLSTDNKMSQNWHWWDRKTPSRAVLIHTIQLTFIFHLQCFIFIYNILLTIYYDCFLLVHLLAVQDSYFWLVFLKPPDIPLTLGCQNSLPHATLAANWKHFVSNQFAEKVKQFVALALYL